MDKLLYHNISNRYYYYKGVTTMAGLKYSRQREAVLNYLRSTKSHPTAEKVYSTVRKEFPRVSLGTIYRNLSLLAERGEILRFSCGDGVEHFDAVTRPHNHFICRQCGSIIDIEEKVVESMGEPAEENFSGKIESYEIYFHGVCEQCLSKNKNKGE